ncbi:hypothetical protein HPP92_011412 [Vanilla planifolia]|uniref:Uncharacterized protein n=1 Tax=Vanilla planifolia TaxID=51239 RepID=A0A835R459_VANPL|nr:hypothetical protein HPP92_011412 [Vanilla planifolia]
MGCPETSTKRKKVKHKIDGHRILKPRHGLLQDQQILQRVLAKFSCMDSARDEHCLNPSVVCSFDVVMERVTYTDAIASVQTSHGHSHFIDNLMRRLFNHYASTFLDIKTLQKYSSKEENLFA